MNMSSQKTLSIVVPVFNGAQYLNATIESLIRIGSEIPIEVIFQDAMSTDGTSEIIEKYILKYQNFKHYKEKDFGQSDAINRGMRKTSGEWVTWLCADDIFLDDFAKMILFVQGNMKIHVVYGDSLFMYGSSGIAPAIGTEKYEKGKLLRRRLFIQQPGTCVRRDSWIANGELNTKLNWVMDYEFFIRLEQGGCQFKRFELFVSGANIHSNAKTSSGSFRRFLEYVGMFWRGHYKSVRYFSLRPYVVYFLEYLIKNKESKSSNGKVLKRMHQLFWKLAQPLEKNDIMERFTRERSHLEQNILEIQAYSNEKFI